MSQNVGAVVSGFYLLLTILNIAALERAATVGMDDAMPPQPRIDFLNLNKHVDLHAVRLLHGHKAEVFGVILECSRKFLNQCRYSSLLGILFKRRY
jgi:hypothetical protein